jgi:V8-like Glu-specific endopeptidase
MPGIPNNLNLRLRATLMDLDEFADDVTLRDVMQNSRLQPWRNRLRNTASPAERAEGAIAYLQRQYTGNPRENALVILLRALAGRREPEDAQYLDLVALAAELERAQAGPVLDPRTVEDVRELQQAVSGQGKMYIVADERLLACARATCQVRVQRVVGNEVQNVYTGTGWLIAPGIVITCWHVLKARGHWETPSDDEVRAQVANSVCLFGYTRPAEGTAHAVEALLAHDNHLDYAVLRLHDRKDTPLCEHGWIRVDPEAPLTGQTEVVVIQHPQGQIQQRSAGRFVERSDRPEAILYDAETDPGTSGGPVLDVLRWRAIALHNGIHRVRRLAEGTLVRAILADLQQKAPEVAKQIAEAQEQEA